MPRLFPVALLLLSCTLAACQKTEPDDAGEGDAAAAETLSTDAGTGPADGAGAESAAGEIVTVRGVTPGDIACYLDVEDAQGQRREQMAAFDICERTDLVDQRVQLTFTTESVAAESCQGDPECTDTREVQLVSAVEIQP